MPVGTKTITGPKFPNAVVVVELAGPSGNAYAIMGMARKAMKREGATNAQVDQYIKEATSNDYKNLLGVTNRWVTLEAN